MKFAGALAALASCSPAPLVFPAPGDSGASGDSADRDGDGWDHDADCDDDDPAIHPGAIEVLGSPTDNDCDGRAGQARLHAIDAGWYVPRRLALTPTGGGFVLVLLSDGVDEPAAGPVAVVISLSGETPGEVPSGPPRALRAPGGGGSALDVEFDGEALALGLGGADGSARALYFDQIALDPLGEALDSEQALLSQGGDYQDLDLVVSGEARWALACSGDALHAARVELGDGAAIASGEIAAGGQTCFFDDARPPTLATVCADACESYALDETLAFSAGVGPWDGRDFIDVTERGDWWTAVSASGAPEVRYRGASVTLPASLGRVQALAAAAFPEGDLFAAILEAEGGYGGEIHLRWRAGFTEDEELLSVDGDFFPTEIALAASGDVAALAVAGERDGEAVVLWTLYRAP